MWPLPKPHLKEFRDRVANVARSREFSQSIKRIAASFGLADSCLRNWKRAADVEDDLKHGTTSAEC